MPAHTLRAQALALWIPLKFSPGFCTRENSQSSFRADLMTRARCKSAEFIGKNLRESAESVDHLRCMRISEMNWMMVEEYLRRDDRGVLPLGCTEQHAYLSLSTDSILAERLASETAEPLGVPVFPVLAYGITPYFRAFPGTITLRVETYMSVVRDILDATAEQGFKRILIVNGHGGNIPAQGFIGEWIANNPAVRIKFHNWWNAPRVWAQVQGIDP